MSLSIISTNGPTRGRAYQAFDLDGIPTIGVVEGEQYAVRVTYTTPRPTKALVSIDGNNPKTGRPPMDDPNEQGYALHGGSVTIDHWNEDSHGGGAFVFTTTDYAVATYKPGAADSAPGYISVVIYEEGMAHRHPTGFAGGSSPYLLGGYTNDLLKGGSYRSSEGATRSAAPPATMGYDLGTGVGERITAHQQHDAHLHAARRVGLFQIRYIPLDVLRDRTPYHPSGFQAAPAANLAGVPRVPSSGDPSLNVVPGMCRFV